MKVLNLDTLTDAQRDDRSRRLARATCIYDDEDQPVCPRCEARPRCTLDSNPQKCADCYREIMAELRAEGLAADVETWGTFALGVRGRG